MDFFDIAQRDLVRLSKRYNIDVSPKSSTYLVVWRRDIRTCDWTTFKEDYTYYEDCLRRWLDDQRWIRGIYFAMRWLSVEVRPGHNGLLQLIVCEAV